jgi:lipopolysaccharide/colanic/teichoic acid biosynthesis glycosyltransferase
MTAMASRNWSGPDDPPYTTLVPVLPSADPGPNPAQADLPRSFYRTRVKRPLEVVLALLLISLFTPFMLAITILILLDSPGATIYAHRRIGLHRREFTMYKFRSMYRNSDNILLLHPEQTAHYATNWKLTHDPRVTRLGRFLRKASLDELPQLYNVLRGEMSLVGPRPYLPHELNDQFGAHADRITRVKPGMTGLWQVSGRSLLAPSRRIELDETYVETCSARLDLLILARTIKAVFKSYGAY